MLRLLFGFEGRVNRAKYWLVHIGVVVLLLMALPVAIVFVWSGLAISVKRWHDRNKSGWWVLIGFVPVIGHLWSLIERGFLPGTPGPNTYGPEPLAAR